MQSVDEILKGITDLCGVADPAQIRNRQGTDPGVGRARLLAARVLALRWKGERDNGRVLSRLDCSPALIRLANRLATTDQSPDGVAFRADLKSLGLATEEKKDPTDKPEEKTGAEKKAREKMLLEFASIGPGEKLHRIREYLELSLEDLKKRNGNQKVVAGRRVIIFVGRNLLSADKRTISGPAGCKEGTVAHLYTDANFRFLNEKTFYDKVGEVCEHFGLSLPRGSKAPE
ncbi:MAG TPA: hypothetical protein VG102_00165 [Candidatus Paceibacterota bacterium]|jgi:hypothetical protein|nr:hypothetical protein [Candidatus Paceibacterota bacterium]